MADYIQPTPRNKLLGLLADGVQGVNNFASAPFGYANPPGQMLMQALGIPDIAKTADRMSYGESLTTGSGMTTKPRPEVMDGLLAAAPMAAGAGLLAAKAAPTVQRGLLAGMENLAVPRTMNPQTGAVVWHGSPHKFDAFDASKIGTGEGNQAYGHGLYFAESPDVAKSYAQQLAMRDSGETPAQIKAAIQQTMDKMQGPRRAQVLAGLRADLAIAKQTTRAGPQTYKVDLPDEHIAKMLDWDKPLSGQHPDVQRAADNLAGERMRQLLESQKGYGVTNKYDTLTGEEFLRGLGSGGTGESALKANGIPGIKYVDSGSRGGGGVSSASNNFVVFPGNEGLLSILERNGKAIK